MNTETNNATETTTEPTMPKVPKAPKTATITLTAPGGTMQIVSERRPDDSARTYVLTIDATTKKSQRGMSQDHPTFEAAKAAAEKLAAKAAKLGWQRTVRRVAFVTKPDAFNTLPLEPIAGWSPSTVRSVLTRDTYRGVVIWNKTRKRNDWGKWAPRDRPESEWIRAEVEHLRIIDDDLWRRVNSRRMGVEGKALRFESGRLSGRPPKHAVLNLLAGLASCGVCKGGLIVESGGKKRGRYPEYICARHRHNGSCPNALRILVADMNEAVLQAIEEHALVPEAIERVVQLTERDDIGDQQDQLLRERQDIEKRIKRLVAAVETAGDVASLTTKLRELEARRTAIDEGLISLRPIPRLAPAVIENRLAEWRRLLHASTTQGRTVLQRIVQGRITFTPRRNPFSDELDGYDFEATTHFGRLFQGLAVERPAGEDAAPLGTEGIGPEDTFDGDYGRLLDRVFENAGKGWRARRESTLTVVIEGIVKAA